MSVPLYQDAIGHFLAGVALSMGDRHFSRNATRYSQARKETKLEQVTSLHYIAEHSDGNDLISSEDYYQSVRKARDFFVSHGEIPRDKKPRLNLAERLQFYKENERINNLPLTSKLGVAFAIELAGDMIVETSQIVWGRGNGIKALGESVIQTPFLCLGFISGKGILYMKDLFRTKEEKELDAMAEELIQDGKILERVRSYSPTQHIKSIQTIENEGERKAISYREIGTNVGRAIDVAGDRISSGIVKGYAELKAATLGRLQERMEAKKAAEIERKNRLKKQYDGR